MVKISANTPTNVTFKSTAEITISERKYSKAATLPYNNILFETNLFISFLGNQSSVSCFGPYCHFYSLLPSFTSEILLDSPAVAQHRNNHLCCPAYLFEYDLVY